MSFYFCRLHDARVSHGKCETIENTSGQIRNEGQDDDVPPSERLVSHVTSTKEVQLRMVPNTTDDGARAGRGQCDTLDHEAENDEVLLNASERGCRDGVKRQDENRGIKRKTDELKIKLFVHSRNILLNGRKCPSAQIDFPGCPRCPSGLRASLNKSVGHGFGFLLRDRRVLRKEVRNNMMEVPSVQTLAVRQQTKVFQVELQNAQPRPRPVWGYFLRAKVHQLSHRALAVGQRTWDAEVVRFLQELLGRSA